MSENIVVAEMTWTEIDEALKERPVALLPVGAIEAHGPHLPVTADSIIATEMAKRGAAKLLEHGVHALILPPVNFTVAESGVNCRCAKPLSDRENGPRESRRILVGRSPPPPAMRKEGCQPASWRCWTSWSWPQT